MSIPTSCTHCGKEYDVGRAFVDRQVTCHTCRKPFQATTTARHRELVAERGAGVAQVAEPLADLDEIPMFSRDVVSREARCGETEERQAKPGGPRKLKIHNTDHGLYSEAPWASILQCPGTWLVGVCVLYCLLAMCLLTGPLRALEPFPVIIAGVIGFVGVCVQGHFYYWRWTEIGELQKKSKEKIADDPPWINRSLIAIVLLPMAGVMLWAKGWYKYDAEQVVAEVTTPLPSVEQPDTSAPSTPVAPSPTPAPVSPRVVQPGPVTPAVPNVNPRLRPGAAPPTFTPPVQPPTRTPPPANTTTEPADAGDSISRLLSVLKQNDTFTSTKAAKSLAAMDPVDERRAEVLAGLNAAMESDNSWVRSDALKAIVVWKDDKTALKIVEVLGKSDDFSYRWELLDLLRELKDPRTAPAIAARVTVSSDSRKALDALKAIGPAAEPAVIPLLQAESFGTRMEVCELLGEIGSAKSIPALRRAEKDSSGLVQARATQAIRQIQSRN